MKPDNDQLIFWALFLALSGLIIFFDKNMECSGTSALPAKSRLVMARVQLAWWTVIVLSAFYRYYDHQGDSRLSILPR